MASARWKPCTLDERVPNAVSYSLVRTHGDWDETESASETPQCEDVAARQRRMRLWAIVAVTSLVLLIVAVQKWACGAVAVAPARAFAEELVLELDLSHHNGRLPMVDIQTNSDRPWAPAWGAGEALSQTEDHALRGTRLLVDDSCRARLNRVEELGAQRLEKPPDVLFPAKLSSISGSGGSCGDVASGSVGDCSHLDKWDTLADIARQHHLHGVTILGPSPSAGDIHQGRLGDCYFLSALASVVEASPKCITDMFVQRHKEVNGVYTTRWLLNGAEVEVAVDDQIPAMYGTPIFARISTGVFWPVILEKAWAKILGSFKSAEAGNWLGAVGAITKAPVKSFWHSDISQDDLWSEIEHASQLSFPMGAGTGDGAANYRLPRSHAYAVLGAYEDSKHGRVVKCFNPWRSDRYVGAIQNDDRTDGIFVMKLEEYYHAFRGTQIGYVTSGYTASLKTIKASRAGDALTFSLTTANDFYVSVDWPMRKLVEPCELTPSVNLAIAKQTGRGAWGDVYEGEESKDASVNMVTARVKGEVGTYDVFVGAQFPSEIADRVVVVVYASEEVDIVPSTDVGASELALAMFGRDCDQETVSFPERGTFEARLDRLSRAVPTYWSIDGAEFAYYAPISHTWFVASASQWQSVSQGQLYYTDRVAASQITCGCKDSQSGVHGLGVPCSQVLPPHIRYSNVMCEGGEFSELVKRCCPVTCGVCDSEAALPVSTPMPTSTPRAAPAPAPPREPAPSELQQKTSLGKLELECRDSHPTGVRLKGQDSQATCAELRGACYHDIVRTRCCQTCAKDEENAAEPRCEDEEDPRLRVNQQTVSCPKALEACDQQLVRQRCCETCQKKDEEDKRRSAARVASTCEDDPDPGIAKGSKEVFCNNLPTHMCSNKRIRMYCCKSCQEDGDA